MNVAPVQVQSKAGQKADGIVVVVDAGIYSARDTAQKVKPVIRMQGEERPRVIKGYTKVKNVAVRIKDIAAWID